MAKPNRQAPSAASAPTSPAPDASGALPSVDLANQVNPPDPDVNPPDPDAQEPSLASLADEESDTPPIPALAVEEPASAPTSPAPEETREKSEPSLADELEWLEARRLELLAKLNKPLTPPAPAPVSASTSKLAEAKRFGVLATWMGPGTYGGIYYTLRGERSQNPTGLTVGYFPLACVKKFKDQFSVQD